MTMIFNEAEQNKITMVKQELRHMLSKAIGQSCLASLVTETWDDFYVTGGVIASMLHGEEPNDIDIYSRNANAIARMSEFLQSPQGINDVAELNANYVQITIGRDPKKWITAQSITMKNKLSFITMLSGTPHHVRANFDYVHCKPYYDIKENKLYISREMFDSIMDKKLVVNNKDQVKSYRTEKFMKRGWKL